MQAYPVHMHTQSSDKLDSLMTNFKIGLNKRIFSWGINRKKERKREKTNLHSIFSLLFIGGHLIFL